MTYYLPSTHCILFSAYILFSYVWQMCYLVHEALLRDEDASHCLTLHAAFSEPGSMAAIFSLASHEEARDVNVSLCLLNTQ